MGSLIKIPLYQLDADKLAELQAAYPNAELSLDLNQTDNDVILGEQVFWEYISLLDWAASDDEAIIRPVVEALAKQPVRIIFEFADILSSKLFQLDRQAIAQHIGRDAWQPQQYFSVDSFLYARACIIANGKAVFDETLADPTQTLKDLTFEALLYVPAKAYRLKTGGDYDYIPAYPIETYSNAKAWELS
jgi:hypothetical protein